MPSSRAIPARAGSSSTSTKQAPPGRGHPRACGEQRGRGAVRAGGVGPSPRVRGAVFRGPPGRDRQGAIPARAGSRSAATSVPARRRGHPRACGEQPSRCRGRPRQGGGHPRACGEQPRDTGKSTWMLGPSPRVRGAGFPGSGNFNIQGAIPARAGSSVSCSEDGAVARGHPRACGEQVPAPAESALKWGPSPRVRGAAGQRCRRQASPGAIPARAGSSVRGGDGTPDDRGHPRACGEQVDEGQVGAGPAGPSPRVRGAERRAHSRLRATGAIPARAGSSSRPVHLEGGWGGAIPARAGSRPGESARALPRGGHPRACGEQKGAGTKNDSAKGPSPRVRGAGKNSLKVRNALGAIPARAGSRGRRRAPGLRRRGHPRACGEQVGGTHGRRRRQGAIPARAGSRLNDLRLYQGRSRFLSTFIDSDIGDI